MFRDQLERLAHPGILGIYVLIPTLFSHVRNGAALQYALPLVAIVAFFAWILSLRRLLAIGSTPTSKVASAAQGYVELEGIARAHPGGALLSRFTQLPCVWFQYTIEERRRDGKWHHVENGRSDDSFLLDDGTGQCLVDPECAEVLPRSTDTIMKGLDWRCRESLILPGDRICALGEFSTIGGETADLDLEHDVGELLAQWKRDKPTLLARFDLDKDGQIGEREWMLARAQARRDVRKTHDEIRSQPGTNVLHKPHDGRLFLISSVDARKLQRRYSIWAWLHLAILLGALIGTAWMRLHVRH